MLEGESHHLLWLWLRLTSLCIREKKSNCADQKKFKQGKPNSQIRRLHTASAHEQREQREQRASRRNLFYSEVMSILQPRAILIGEPFSPGILLTHTHVCFTIPSMCALHQTKDESHQQAEGSHFLPNFQV